MPISAVSLFFFQAEDGIRDGHVTGVQTCALPILPGIPTPGSAKKAFNYTQRWGKRWGRGVVCHNCFSPNPCQLTQAAITLEVAVSRLRKAPLRRVGRRAGAN